MPKKSYRRRAAEAASTSAAGAGVGSTKAVDPNVALFASWVKEEEAREKAEKAAARAERRAAAEHQRLIDAKEAAATELKRLRQRGGAGAERVAAADLAYREALAALITHETGEAPAWAPDVAPVDASDPVDTPDSAVVADEAPPPEDAVDDMLADQHLEVDDGPGPPG